MPSITLNYLAVFFAACIPMVLGSLWYSPLLFGNVWMKEMGFTTADRDAAMKKGMGKTYAMQFVGALITAFVTASLVKYLALVTLGAGVQLAFMVWAGFIATVMLGEVLWNRRSWRYYAIGAGYQLIMLVLMTSLLILWQ